MLRLQLGFTLTPSRNARFLARTNAANYFALRPLASIKLWLRTCVRSLERACALYTDVTTSAGYGLTNGISVAARLMLLSKKGIVPMKNEVINLETEDAVLVYDISDEAVEAAAEPGRLYADTTDDGEACIG